MSDRVSPAQIRGARAMLDWSMMDLAGAAGLSVSTVKRIERGEGQPVSDEARSAVRAALERAGAVLTQEDSWMGVRMKAAVSPSHATVYVVSSANGRESDLRVGCGGPVPHRVGLAT